MIFPTNKLAWTRSKSGKTGFTLVEMLVVLAIMAILSVLIAVSFSGLLNTSYDSELTNFAGLLSRARAYAMANNSYVFVGIQEIDSTVPPANTQQTPTLIGGAIMVAVITTSDGSRGYDPTGSTTPLTTSTPPSSTGAVTVPDPNYLNSSSGTGGNNTLVAASPVIVSPVQRFDNLHIIAANATAGNPNNLVGFTGATSGLPGYGQTLNVVNLGDPAGGASALTFSWPPGGATPKYNFSQVIQFNPQGEAQIINGPNVDGNLQYIEIDLEPMHGKALPTPQNPNNAAIVIDGISGSIRIFRT